MQCDYRTYRRLSVVAASRLVAPGSCRTALAGGNHWSWMARRAELTRDEKSRAFAAIHLRDNISQHGNSVPIHSNSERVVRAGAVSPVELTTDCLARIEKLNPKLNAFITVTAESALAQAAPGRSRNSARRLARTAARHSARAQGFDRHRRRSHHRRQSAVQRPHSRRRCRNRSPLESCRRRAAGEAESARVRLRRQFDDQLFRRSAKRVEPGAHRRRFFGRLSDRRRRRIGLWRDRHRHRGVGPGARRALRRGRPETNLRAGQRPGRDSAFNFARSRWADRTYASPTWP